MFANINATVLSSGLCSYGQWATSCGQNQILVYVLFESVNITCKSHTSHTYMLLLVKILSFVYHKVVRDYACLFPRVSVMYEADILSARPDTHRDGSLIYKKINSPVSPRGVGWGGDITKEPMWAFDIGYVA